MNSQNSKVDDLIKKKINRRVKIFGILTLGVSIILYLNKNQPSIARKLYFDRIFNSDKKIQDDKTNFVNFY